MIKVSLAKKFGIKLVNGDMITSSGKSGSAYMIGRTAATYFNGTPNEDYRRVESFTTRLISDGIPASIDGDVLLEITNGNVLVLYISARNVAWHAWKTWRPSMEWLVQQAADKPVTYKDDTQFFGGDVQVGEDPKVALIHKAWVDLNGSLQNLTNPIEDGNHKQLVICTKAYERFSVGCYTNAIFTNDIGDDYWKVICTIKEFNDYSEKMKAYTGDVPKVQSNKIKVTLNDADDISKGFMSRCVVVPVSIEPFQDGYSVGYKLPHESTVSPEPTKPIFTQAMADAGELPPVGFKCLVTPHNGLWGITRIGDYAGEVIHYDDGEQFVFKLDTKTIDASSILVSRIDKVDFKPLDTRTEKQKEVDLALAEWPIADKPTLEFAYDYWLSGRKQ